MTAGALLQEGLGERPRACDGQFDSSLSCREGLGAPSKP